jgi:hypothetical protein
MLCVALVACESPAEARNTDKMNRNATITAPADVYDTIALSTVVDSLDVGEEVVVKEKSRCSLKVCLVEHDEISGWIRCANLDMAE